MSVLKIIEPNYCHREYKNDIKKTSEEEPSWIQQSKRISKVALPFISLYKPLSRPLSLVTGSFRVITSVSDIISDLSKGNTKEIPQHLLQTTIAVISLAGTLFLHPLGMLITTGHDLIIELISLAQHLQAGDYEKALVSCANILNNALYLALICGGGIKLSIASLALQILLGLYHSKGEFQNGNYLEGVGHLLMAVIRGGQMGSQAHSLYQDTLRERAAIQVKRIEHRKSVQTGLKQRVSVLQKVPGSQLLNSAKLKLAARRPSLKGRNITQRTLVPTPQAVDSSAYIERRAVVDVGSGSTKFCIADVDTRTQQVVNVVLRESYAVPYQAAMEASYDHTFSVEVKERGLETFRTIDALCKEHGVQKVTAVATEAFRQSMNGEKFAAEVNEKTQIPLRIITQKEEGEIAFYSAASLVSDIPKEELVVWDIGTGSYQMSIGEKDQDLTVFMGSVGSVPFKNYIVDVVQAGDSSQGTTLHPLTREEHLAADRYARALARKAYPNIKEKITSVDRKVSGIGRLFTNSLLPFAEDDQKITRADLRKFIESNYGKTKEEMNDPYSEANLSNAILVLGFMKALHIKEIRALDAASSQGMLTFPKYWA